MIGTPGDKRPPTLLLVDSDRVFAHTVARRLVAKGWTVDVTAPDLFVETGPSGGRTYTHVALDLCPDGHPQLGLLESARQRAPHARLIVLTAFPSVALRVTTQRMGASDFLIKPISPEELVIVIGSDDLDDGERLSLPSLARLESEYIARVLSYTKRNISVSAKILGIRRSTLQRKLKKYPPLR
jgi:two-component system response regulator RegA